MKPSSLAGHAIELIEILLRDQRPADQLIDNFFRQRRYLGSHDRRELAETAYGILRNLRLLQELVARLKPNLEKQAPWLLATYKLHVEKKSLTEIKNFALALSVDELASLAAQPIDGVAGKNIGVQLSFPDWLVDALQQQMGDEESVRLLESLNEPPPLTIRVNTIKTTRDECLRELRQRGFECAPSKLSPDGIHLSKRANLFALDLFQDGWFELQDEGSQIISLLLDPKPTWRIADVCAGGGGKTLHLAALMKNRGEIFAFDVVPRRLENLQKRLRRAGVHNVRTQLLQEDQIPGQLLGKMDAILIDAPCSGTGVLRRNPDAKWKISPEMVREMAEKQKSILHHYAPLLEPGGRLVYATCSLLADENEKVIESFLGAHADYHFAHAAEILRRYDLANLADGSYVRLFPHIQGCDGFFAAVLERTDDSKRKEGSNPPS
jgi:16S rRNA (cytosine967-C5)-methyltransferase